MATPNRYYSSTAQPTALLQNLDTASVSLKVAAVTGFPTSFPYTLTIDAGLTGQEVVTVTAASGTTLTVTRGVDSTAASTHITGAVVTHSTSARDYAEPQAFIANFFIVTGVPSGSLGSNGQFAFRTDTPGTTNQRLYVKSAGSWVGIL